MVKYVATHICDSIKRRLKADGNGAGVQGEFGIGLEPTIYLVPECDSLDQALEYLGESIRGIFEEQLDGWYRAPQLWPVKRHLSTFRSWFEVSFHSMIVDLSDDVLEHEAL